MTSIWMVGRHLCGLDVERLLENRFESTLKAINQTPVCVWYSNGLTTKNSGARVKNLIYWTNFVTEVRGTESEDVCVWRHLRASPLFSVWNSVEGSNSWVGLFSTGEGRGGEGEDGDDAEALCPPGILQPARSRTSKAARTPGTVILCFSNIIQQFNPINVRTLNLW